tara:strand:- start:180 stop:755 length:576 start_codon:yes stop_codon:yes gene_type:complete
MASETNALLMTLDTADLAVAIASEMYAIRFSLHVRSDAQSVVDAAMTLNRPTEKRLLVDLANLRERRIRGTLDLRHVSTLDQVADPLTKEMKGTIVLRVMTQNVLYGCDVDRTPYHKTKLGVMKDYIDATRNKVKNVSRLADLQSGYFTAKQDEKFWISFRAQQIPRRLYLARYRVLLTKAQILVLDRMYE